LISNPSVSLYEKDHKGMFYELDSAIEGQKVDNKSILSMTSVKIAKGMQETTKVVKKVI
jgi:hypothetical protein